jgi:hypothetical protein
VSLTRLLTIPCVVYRRALDATDEYGNRVMAEDTGTPAFCELQQMQATEFVDSGTMGRRIPISEWRVYLDPAVLIDANDQVEVGGVRYTVDGEPWPVNQPRVGTVHHIEAMLRRIS